MGSADPSSLTTCATAYMCSRVEVVKDQSNACQLFPPLHYVLPMLLLFIVGIIIDIDTERNRVLSSFGEVAMLRSMPVSSKLLNISLRNLTRNICFQASRVYV